MDLSSGLKQYIKEEKESIVNSTYAMIGKKPTLIELAILKGRRSALEDFETKIGQIEKEA